MQKQIKVLINGKQYSLATDEHEEVVIRAAELVGELIEQNKQKFPTASDDRINLAVALHVATELAKKERELALGEAHVKKITALLDGNI